MACYITRTKLTLNVQLQLDERTAELEKEVDTLRNDVASSLSTSTSLLLKTQGIY